MEKPKFVAYTRPNGHNEFEGFYNSLPNKDRNKIRATIDMIEEVGILPAIQLEVDKEIRYWNIRNTIKSIFKYSKSFIFSCKKQSIYYYTWIYKKDSKNTNKRNNES